MTHSVSMVVCRGRGMVRARVQPCAQLLRCTAVLGLGLNGRGLVLCALCVRGCCRRACSLSQELKQLSQVL